MDVASPNGRRRARRDSRIVQPMMPAIPPVDYPVPGAGRGVTLDIILFSGTTREDLSMMVLPGGLIVRIIWTMPTFFMDTDRLEYESNGQVNDHHSRAAAQQEGVRLLRPRDNAPVEFSMDYALPIQVQEQMHEDEIELIAIQNSRPGHEGQYVYYLRLTFRGMADGYVAPTVPAFRFLGPQRAAGAATGAATDTPPASEPAPSRLARFWGGS
jgi:hypothetical protein